MSMKTKIIAIEGIDGSGKTLQMQRLCAYLREKGYTVGIKSFPEYESFFGKQIGALLKGDILRADMVDSRSMCLWFALDRWQSFADFKDAQYDFLLVNRYVLSNAVYQAIRDIDLGTLDNWEWVKALEYGQLGLPVPSLYLLLDVDPSSAQDNVDKKGAREYIDGRDVYEQQKDLLTRARNRYLDIAKREQNFEIISCMDGDTLHSPDEIAQRIIDALICRKLVKDHE